MIALEKKNLILLQFKYHLSEFLLFQWVLYFFRRCFYLWNMVLLPSKKSFYRIQQIYWDCQRYFFFLFYKACCNIFSSACLNKVKEIILIEKITQAKLIILCNKVSYKQNIGVTVSIKSFINAVKKRTSIKNFIYRQISYFDLR